MANNYYIKNMEEKISRGDFTYFLTSKEGEQLSSILDKKKIKYFIYKPYPNAEKIIFYRKRKPYVSIYEIKTHTPLTHSAILGVLYANSIKREMYGDILVNEKMYIIILKEIEKYLFTHIHEIKGQKIIWKKANFSDIKSFIPIFDIIEIKTISSRIDTVLSHLLHLSRNIINKKILEKKVLINEKIVTKGTITVKEKDVFTVRGYGKYIYEKEEKRKDKLYIIIKKYK